MRAGPTAKQPDSCQHGWANLGQTKRNDEKWTKTDDGWKWYEIRPICHLSAPAVQFFYVKMDQITYLWISAARPQCNCEPAVDGTESLYAASEKTKRVEGIGGQNDEPAWVPVTDKPLGEKDLLLLPGLWLHFHWGMCQFWIIRLNALWIKWFVFQAKEWSFLDKTIF